MKAETTKEPKAPKAAPPRIHKEIVLMDVDALVPNKWNPNKMDEEIMESLVHGVKTEGQVQPVLIQKDTNVIIDGEHRWMAVKRAGSKKVGAIVLDCSDVEAKKLTLAMNNRRGRHETEALDKLLSDLHKQSGDLSALDLGYSEEMLDRLLATSPSFLNDMAGGEDDEMPDLGGDDEPLPEMGGADYTKLQYLATSEQKKVILQAINKAKDAIGTSNSTEAMVHISRYFIDEAAAKKRKQ